MSSNSSELYSSNEILNYLPLNSASFQSFLCMYIYNSLSRIRLDRTDTQFIPVIEDTSFNWRAVPSKQVIFCTCTTTGRNTSLKRIINCIDHLELYHVCIIKK